MAAMSQKRGKEKGEIGRQSRGVDRLTGDLESMVEEVVFVSRQMGFEGEVFRRSASQILERTRQLQRAATSDLQGDEAKAQSLLASKSFDIEKQQKRLATLTTKRDYGPQIPLTGTDLDSYLRHTRQMIVCTAIEESQKTTIQRFNESFSSTVGREWEQERTLIMEQLGHLQPRDLSRSRKKQYIFDPNLTSPLDVSVDHHARIVAQISSAGTLGEIVHSFLDLTDWLVRENLTPPNYTASTHSVLRNCWGLLAQVTKTSDPFQRVQYTLRHLENQYSEYVREEVAKDPRLSERSGIPGRETDIARFVKLRLKNDPSLKEMEPWVEIFLLMRCGDAKAALRKAERSAASSSVLVGNSLSGLPTRTFCEAFSRWLHHAPLDEYVDQLVSEYGYSISNPWRSAVFSVLGFEPPQEWDEGVVLNQVEHSLWFSLSMIRSDLELEAKLEELYFALEESSSSFRDPLIYPMCLFCAQKYSHAIHHLYHSPSSFEVEAVHLGMILYLSGDELNYHSRSFLDILEDYTRCFPPSECHRSLEYFLLLRPNLRTTAITDLLLKTHQFDLLAGRLDQYGRRIPGLIEERWPGDSELTEVLLNTANEAAQRGQGLDAVQFYFLAGQMAQGLELLGNLLGRDLVGHGFSSDRVRLKQLATVYSELARTNLPTKERSVETLEKLLLLADFFDAIHSGQNRTGLEIIYRRLDILPELTSELQSKVLAFERLSENIRRNFGDILVGVMKVLCSLQREEDKPEYRRLGSTIISFYNMLKYKISSEANTELLRLSVLLA